MPEPLAPAAPVLATVPRVELIHAGTWKISTGEWEVTSDDLYAAVAAQGCPAVRRPVLKLGHVPGPGSPTLGTVTNLAVADGGSHLVGDFTGMPAWMTRAGDDGTSVLASAYPDRSVEGQHDYRCQLGHTHPFVLTAVALLGVEEPGVGTLESLASLYGVAASAPPPTVTEEGPVPIGSKRVAAQATVDDVRSAYYASPGGAGWDTWIEDMFVDPPELIVVNDTDGTLSRVPYTVASDGAVTFGDAQKVQRTYVAAAAAVRTATASWASPTESRPGAHGALRPGSTPRASASGSTEQGGRRVATFELDDEQVSALARRLGLPDGADAETVATALGTAAGPAPTNTPGDAGEGGQTTPVTGGETILTTGTTASPAAQVIPATGTLAAPNAQSVPGVTSDGTVVLDAAAYAELRAAADQGVAARAQQIRESRDSFIAAAASEGRFPLERQSYWRTYMDADEEGARQMIAKFPVGSAIPVAASTAGHAGTTSVAAAAADDTGGDYAWLPGVPHPSAARSDRA